MLLRIILLAVGLLAVGVCTVGCKVSMENRPCPCITGYHCCDGICVADSVTCQIDAALPDGADFDRIALDVPANLDSEWELSHFDRGPQGDAWTHDGGAPDSIEVPDRLSPDSFSDIVFSDSWVSDSELEDGLDPDTKAGRDRQLEDRADAARAYPPMVACAGGMFDPLTNLCWRTLTPLPQTWAEAGPYCDDLVEGGHDTWRLPTLSELRSLLRGCPNTELGGACPYGPQSDDWTRACDGCGVLVEDCYWDIGLGSDCSGQHFWSSTVPGNPHGNRVYTVSYSSATITPSQWGDPLSVRCVRLVL